MNHLPWVAALRSVLVPAATDHSGGILTHTAESSSTQCRAIRGVIHAANGLRNSPPPRTEADVRTVATLAMQILAMVSAVVASAAAVADGCKLGRLVELPVTMDSSRPLITAKINDVPVQFVLDSGAFYSLISAADAAQLKLRTAHAADALSVQGINGTADVSVATVKTLVLADVSLHDVELLVGGSGSGEGSIGLLGQDFLHRGDVEYDLARGAVRLMKPVDCSKAMLGYWAGPSTSISVLDTWSDAPLSGDNIGSRIHRELRLSRTLSHAYVNGTEIRVIFDTGAETSMLSLEAAARAGIKPDSPGVVSAGTTFGIGRKTVATYLAPISSFKIGEEEIRNTRIRFGDIDLAETDMLIGADFFLSHRIYVANSQHKLYFTYNGGPVFNLKPTSRPADEPAAAEAPTPKRDPAEEAADYERRGTAFASRHEFDQALSALTQACALDPENPEYLYQRGLVYRDLQQSAPALADFDRALALKPKDLRGHLARAQLLLERGEAEPAVTDLDAADAIAPNLADERLQLGGLYEEADHLQAAVKQFNLWIDAHPDDARLAEAFNARCWVRALAGTELPLALSDCNAALRRAQKSTQFYAKVSDSRGLVLLRMGDYDRSIADYDASLKTNAKSAWSLFGRGIDKLRKQETAAGNADIAAATAVLPRVAEQFSRHGIVP